ncbi:MAG: DUF4349 domain-containing protein [Vicinamibacteria bacterium]|jgi:hypothetical protein|nr:DUF4349 domain-containing protein [Vicinamibacteria bacterium]
MRRWQAGSLVVALVAMGCGEKRAPAEGSAAPAPARQAMAAEQQASAGGADKLKALGDAAQEAVAGTAQAQDVAAAMVAARKLIRTGQIDLEVAAFPAAAEKASAIAGSQGGYVADSKQSRADSGVQRGSLVLRVPAERFADALAALRALGTVRSENVSAQDVTKAYADLETRLRVKRETLERLRDILRKQTGKLQDVLEVEREIARVTEEIEAAEGERRYYDQQIALSTIHVELGEPAPLMTGGAFDVIGEALRESVRVLAGSLAAMVFLAAAGLPWLLLVYVLFRLYRWRRPKKVA